MGYKYIYVTEDPKEVSPILTPLEGGDRITRIYVKDGKLQVEYNKNEED